MKTIILDPAFGGKETGAVYGDYSEKDLNLKIATYLYQRLQALGARVYLLRKEDKDINPFRRIMLVKNLFDYCVSIRFSTPSEEGGIELVHSVKDDSGFTEMIGKNLTQIGFPRLKYCGSKTTPYQTDYHYMQRLTGCTQTIVLNMGNLNCERDLKNILEENLFICLMEAILRAICDKIEVHYQVGSIE